MSLGRTPLGHIFQTIKRLRALIQPRAIDVSTIDIPYPPLFESVPPAKFRHAIPLAISTGALTCVLIVFDPNANKLIFKHLKNLVSQFSFKTLVTDTGALARETNDITIIRRLHFNQSHLKI
jgi:hypothetical protein